MIEKPVVIKNKLKKWKILSLEEKDWCNAFQGEILRFRKGLKSFREDPYWEQDCEDEFLTISDFFDISKSEDESNFWLYFDYRYMKDVIPANSELIKQIKWSDFGLKHLKGEDSTIWIGNKGAHTPCHMDTYGCNLVAQVRGSKSWILIPPEESDLVCPIRVPYEESSIYSSYNFYTPTLNLLKLRNCYRVILNPGELLFIPKHWWHYVENLELSISINVWIPQESDHEDRLQEALVRNYVSNICQGLTKDEAMLLLNPNERELMSDPYDESAVKLIADNLKKIRNEKRSDDLEEFEIFLNENGVEVPAFSREEIGNFIAAKSRIHGYQIPDSERTSAEMKRSFQEILINSYCNPKIVELIKNRLVDSL